MKEWMKLIPQEDVQTYLRGGLLADIKFGKRPGLLVVDECCFDRSYFAHCANLFTMLAKYAAVVSLDELTTLTQPMRKANAA